MLRPAPPALAALLATLLAAPAGAAPPRKSAAAADASSSKPSAAPGAAETPPSRSSATGAAETAPSKGEAVAPSSQARALSRALVPKQTWDRLLDRSAEGLSQAVSRSLSTKGTAVPDGLQGKIRGELGKSMNYETAVDTQAQALQKRFTPDELDSATRFYSSPVGKKMLERLPEAQSEVGDKLQEQLAMVVPEIIHRVAPAAAAQEQGSGAGATPAPPSGAGAGP